MYNFTFETGCVARAHHCIIPLSQWAHQLQLQGEGGCILTGWGGGGGGEEEEKEEEEKKEEEQEEEDDGAKVILTYGQKLSKFPYSLIFMLDTGPNAFWLMCLARIEKKNQVYRWLFSHI